MRKVALFGAAAVILLLPFFIDPWAHQGMREQFETPKLMVAFLLGNLGLAMVLGDRIAPAFGVLHTAFSFCVWKSGFGAMQLYPYAYWVAGAGLTAYYVSLDGNARHLIRKCIYGSGVLVSIHAGIQVLMLEHYLNDLLAHMGYPFYCFIMKYAPGVHEGLPIAFLRQRTLLGCFIAPIAAAAVAEGYLLAALPMILIAGATNSSFTWLALAGGLFIAARRWVSRKTLTRLGIAAVIAIALAWCAFPKLNRFDDHGRRLIWKETYAAWHDHGNRYRIFGFGPGAFNMGFSSTFESKQNLDGNGEFLQAHNDYLQVLFDFGEVGFAALLFALFALACAYYEGWRAWNCISLELLAAQAAGAAFLLNALGNFPFQLSPQYLLALIFLGALLHAQNQRRI